MHKNDLIGINLEIFMLKLQNTILLKKWLLFYYWYKNKFNLLQTVEKFLLLRKIIMYDIYSKPFFIIILSKLYIISNKIFIVEINSSKNIFT